MSLIFRVAMSALVVVPLLSGCLDGSIVDPLPTTSPTRSPTLDISVSSTPDAIVLEPADSQGSGFLTDREGPKLEKIIWRYNPASVSDVSSIIASDGMLYLTYRIRDFNSEIHVVDAKTGQLEWRIEGARSPAIANGMIYYSRGCTLYGADLLTHQENWKFETSCGEKDAWLGSPTVQDGVIYFDLNTINHNYGLYAVDLRSGQLRWKSKTGEFVRGLTVKGKTLYFRTHIRMNNAGPDILWVDGLFAFDAIKGVERWKFEPPGGEGTERIIQHMTISNDTVYFVISGWFGSGEEYLYALDSRTGELRWKFRPSQYAHELGYVAANDELVYLTTGGGFLYGLDAQTGAEEWTFQAGNSFLAPSLVDDVLYVSGNTRSGPGHLYAIESKTGKELSRLLLGSEITSSPLVLEDILYVTQAHSGDYLTAVR